MTRGLNNATNLEFVITEVCKRAGNLVAKENVSNPCKLLKIELGTLNHGNIREIWCVDFNAHNSLWGRSHTDNNGEIVEELTDERSLVCLNNCNGTGIDVYTNSTSCIDLTLVSRNTASSCEWSIKDETTIRRVTVIPYCVLLT